MPTVQLIVAQLLSAGAWSPDDKLLASGHGDVMGGAVIATADPFTYAVHGFKALLLKEAGLAAIWYDLLFLTLFAAVMLSIATPLFKRTL